LTAGRQWRADQLHVRGLANDVGPGNALTITIAHEAVTGVFMGFGEKGVSAQSVAKGSGGDFATLPVSDQFNSHVAIIDRFPGRRIAPRSDAGVVHVTVSG
jgi:hypothetical protein